jgi:hypothetical protein
VDAPDLPVLTCWLCGYPTAGVFSVFIAGPGHLVALMHLCCLQRVLEDVLEEIRALVEEEDEPGLPIGRLTQP